MIQLIKQLAGDAKIVFDVGAAEGSVTEGYLGMFPNAVVYAFEPTPGLCKLKSGRRVKVVKVAVAEKSGTATLYLNRKPHTNSLLPFVKQGGALVTHNTVEVPAVSLDDFCREVGIEWVDVLKIDTQGTELQVLVGATGLFNKGAVKVVVVELQGASIYAGQCKRGDVGKFLSHYGFVLKYEQVASTRTHSDGVFAK